MDRTRASATAVLVAQGRAVADGRLAVGRFADPTARWLLRDDELVDVDVARGEAPPRGWSARMGYEMLRANAEVMAPRTVAIDDAVRAAASPQVVILGAGLDGRAWRMAELGGADVFEVDHPASQRDKLDRVGSLTPAARSLHLVPVDLTVDDLDAALAGAGHRPTAPTTWIWEGVVPYLTPLEVEATVRLVAARSAPGSRLVVNYQTASVTATLGRLAARAMAFVARRHDPLAAEPRRSHWSPAAMAGLLDAHGFAVLTDVGLLDVAADLGVDVTHDRSIAPGRVAVADT
jgi:methyltransferase (TIGR00027 family)